MNDNSLQNALAYAQSIVETVRDPLLVLDGDLRIQTASRSFCQAFRVRKDEAEGRLVYELGNGQWDIPQLRHLLEQILPQDSHFDDFEVEHGFPEIGHRVMRLNARRINGPHPHSQLILLAIEDVTERKRAEDALEAQKEWLRVTLSSIGDAVIATDMQGRVTFMNAVAESLTGWATGDVEGLPLQEVFKIISEDDRQPVESPATKALRENAIVGFANHTLLIRKDGSEVSIADSAAPIRSAAGAVLGVVLIFRDVTEERRAEIAIRDAKRYAENIVDTVRHPMLVLDGELRVQTANRSFYQNFRVSADETENRFIYDLGNGQWDIPKLRSLLTEILPQNTSFDDFEMEHNFPAIGHRYMRLNARRMYREGEHSELILLAIEDVTEQRRLEEERREIETRFTSLVKNIKDHSIFTLDPQGYVTSWNVEAENILGYSEQEALGQHFSLIFTSEDIERGVPQQELDAASEKGRAEDERWHRRKNGELLWALGIVTPTHDAQGRHTGYSKILRDMTARKRAEEILRKQSDQLRMLWEAAAVLLIADDPDAMMQQVFAKVSDHLGVDTYFHFAVDETGEALRLVSCIGISDETARSVKRLEFGRAVCGMVALQRQPIVATHIQQSDDPKVQLVKGLGIRAYACNPLMAEDQLIGTLSFASRTREQFDQDELSFFETLCHYVTFADVRLRLMEQLRDADRRKNDFLATLAHELRNPLAPIRNGLQVIRLAGDDKQTVEQARNMMERQLHQMVRLIDDLLDISRITRNKLELRKQRVELKQVVQSALEAAQPLIEQQEHELAVALPSQPVLLDADPTRLAQVFANLLTNAAKYTEQGGRICLAAERQGSDVVVSVRDTGIGIAAEHQPQLFEMFSQVAPALDRSQGGLGIGLALVRGLVTMHGGSIEARSEGPGRGSEFIVRLPVLIAPAEAEAQSAPVTEGSSSPNKCRILVVDDNKDAAKMLALTLRLQGHEVHTAHDGQDAVDQAAALQPDAILLDIGLPKMNGYEACRHIRQQGGGEKITMIALTGWGQEEDKQKAKEAGFDHHFTKPVDAAALAPVLGHSRNSIES